MKKGVFCISIDLELLWGRKDLNYRAFISKTKKERGIIKKLLNLFKKYNIAATWAVVGKMLENRNSLWSGRDIIKLIRSYPNQEIGSHTYSHEVFIQIGYEKAKEEVEKTVEIFKKEKISYTSFVFPRNKVHYLNLIKKNGFKAYRGPDRRKWELLYPLPPPVFTPSISNGLVNIPGSMYFVSGRGIRKYIPFGIRFLKIFLGINRAIKEKKVFHLWFHPVDFADNEEKLLKELELVLKYVNQKQDNGLLLSLNMKGITNEKIME